MPFEADAGGFRFTNALGETVLDSDNPSLHIVDNMKGSATVPRSSIPTLGSGSLAPTNLNVSIDLGAVSAHAQVMGGSFRITNAEGLSVGEKRFLRTDTFGQVYSIWQRYLYAPRFNSADVLPVGGVTVLDFAEYPWGGVPRLAGRMMHFLQFTLSGGRIYLNRSGLNTASLVTKGAVPNPVGLTPYGDIYDCAALTIDYRIWLGAFT